jgi:hypothetical protein
MAKKVWLTWIGDEQGPQTPAKLVQALQKNGLEVSGAKWSDDLAKMAWTALAEVLVAPDQTDIWVIAADKKSLAAQTNRYALSMLTIMVREVRGAQFPIILLGLDAVPESDSLPTLLHSFTLINLSDASWPAKVVASSFAKRAEDQPDYRLSLRANPMFGQWFEVGPAQGTWHGVMFGVNEEANITLHAVGPKGTLPERTVLEYQIKDMKATIGETEFIAWAVQNELDPDTSYYVKVEGFPGQIIFGGHPGTDQAEVNVIRLK